MEAASLCPKCGIELQAELGSRCPLCGTPLRANERAEASFARTNPPIPALESNPAAIIPVDPASAPTGALTSEEAEATTTSGWSIEAAPPSQPEALRPAPSSPFTPMPSLVTPTTSLPPPPFAAGVALRPAAAPLPGPPVLGNPQVSDPDSAVTAVMAGPPMPAPRLLIVESAAGDEDAVDASSLEVTRTAPGAPAPAAPAPRPRASSLSPSPAIAAGAAGADAPTLSPSRVPLRAGSDSLPPPPLVEPPAIATAPAARVPLVDRPSAAGPKAISRPSPSAIPRASSAPAAPVERSPSRTRGVLFFFATVAAVAGAFYAGRLTAPAAGSLPLPPIATPAETPELAASPAPTPTEEAAAPSPEEETSAAPDSSETP